MLLQLGLTLRNRIILINTAVGRIKQKNISRDGRLALAIADQTNPYDMVTLRGKVIEQITGSVAEKHIDKLAKKVLRKRQVSGQSSRREAHPTQDQT